MRRYRSERSVRWLGFRHRPGDIVVSTRSKCGTTWMQMICLTLIHGHPLPERLSLLSPWIDWDLEPTAIVHERLARQDHRRVIKTHTPLDGIPLRDDVRYVVVGRHPLDVAVSRYHHVANLDQARSADLRGEAPVARPEPGSLATWLADWVDDDRPPEEALDTLAGNVHHVADAWARQRDGNVLLIHFTDLVADPAGTIGRVADWLGLPVSEERWPDVLGATSLVAMRADAASTVPDHLGVLKDPDAFFRSGAVGDGLRQCPGDTLRRYHDRLATLAPTEIATWIDHTAA